MGRVCLAFGFGCMLAVGACKPATDPSTAATPAKSTATKAPPAQHGSHPVSVRGRGHVKSPKRAGSPPGAGCTPTRVCNGSATPELEAAFQYRALGTRRCYERELRHTPKVAEGRIAVQVQLDATGHVCQATIVEGQDWASRALSNCVTKVMAAEGYPAPLDDCVDVKVPLRFVANRS